MKSQAPINRAYRIGRVPKVAAAILRELDAEGLLGVQLLVIGTHSLYAYEAAAGVHLADDLQPHVQGLASIGPAVDRQRRPVLGSAHGAPLSPAIAGLEPRLQRLA